jgi:hypothetical protein
MYLLNEKLQAKLTGRDYNDPHQEVHAADPEEVEAATPPVLV